MTGERILNGRYIVGELIGRGGMADVHLGVDQVLGRKVAIKLLRPEMARDPMVQARFRREAKAVAGLNHPNIVSVYDTGEENREINGSFVDLPFIVMEYVSGRTLRDLNRAGEITVELAIDYVLGVLEALQHSHAMGIVHRDIKPANIMVTSQGALKVMDFGIARALADSSSTMTQTQTVVGTAQYLSPEQARGETVDARTDLYSTGCLLYELLTGRPPFTGDSPVSVAYQHVGEHAPAPSSVKTTLPPIYDDVVIKALAKDREDRYSDAHAFADALRNARNGIPLPPEELTAVLPQEPAPATVIDYTAAAAESEQPFHTGYLEPVAAEQHWNEQPMWDQDRSEPVDDYRAKSKKAWTVVLSIIMVLALAVGGLFFYNWMQAEAARNALVTIPSLANMTQVEAEAALTNLELIPKPEDVFDDTVKSGSVVSSNPVAQAQVVKGTAVTLMVSKGPESLKIPTSLAGATEVTARETLKDMGFTIGSVTRKNDPTIPSGSLVGTEPSLGSQVKSGSKIDLILSTGLVVVPQLLNLTEDEARALLSDPKFGLSIIVREEEHAVAEPGTIIRQNPDSGSTSPQGGTVTVTVAKEPVVETPTTTDEPSDEPTDEPTPPQDSTGPDSVPGSFDESLNGNLPGTGNLDRLGSGRGLLDD